MSDIKFLEPTSLPEVLNILEQYGEEVQVLAGGAFLTLVLKLGLLAAKALVSLRNVPDLARIEARPDGGLSLGTLVTHRAVELSPLIQSNYPLLVQTYAQVANVRIRHQATVGGNLVAADYASDPPAALIALGARVRLVSVGGERLVPVQEFITGHYQTIRRPNELLTEVILPPPVAQSQGVYLKFKSRSSEDRPCVSVAALGKFDEVQHCEDLRVVVGAAAESPQVVADALNLARGERLTSTLIQEISRRYAAAIDPISDLRGSAWYRQQLIEVLVRRAISTIAATPPGTEL